MEKVKLTPLKEVKPDNKAITVKVFILRQGSEITTKQGKTIRKMILVDEEGTLIHGLIFSNVMKQFEGVLETNKTYMIHNPHVRDINSRFENVHTSYELSFQRGTIVTELLEKLAIPKLTLGFKIFNEITPQLSEKENQHIIGVVKNVKQLIVFSKSEGNNGYKREIILLDTMLTSITITLWDDLAVNEAQMMKHMKSDCPIISLTNLRMQEYNRLYQLASTNTTAVFFNPPCTHTDALNSWLDTERKRNKLHTIWLRKMLVETQCLTIDEVVKNRTTLTENTYYRLKGTIKGIENGSSPYYEACDHCLKEGTRMTNNLACLNCIKLQIKIVPRYRLSFLLDDGTNIARITIFDKVVEGLIGYPVEEYIKIHNQLPSNTGMINPLDKLLEKDYNILFKLDQSVDTRPTICSIEADGVDKISHNLNKDTKSKKERLTKKSKVQIQSIIMEEKKTTTSAKKQDKDNKAKMKQIEIDDTKGKMKKTEIEDNETLGDYTKRKRTDDASKSNKKLGKIHIKQEK